MYTCENCDKTFHEDDMHMLDPVQECRECAEATENYWAGQYDASGRQPEVEGGYDLDDGYDARDLKSEKNLDRLLELADIAR